ncbi:MAG: hypothetical protein AAGA33_12790 [Pseudomonadota bacterium]
MSNSPVSLFRNCALWLVAAIPWLVSMYAFYWLDSSGTWTIDTPHRGKLSVLILGSGMLLSFALHARLRTSLLHR